MKRPPRIQLTIDRVVLRGIPREHRDSLLQALQAELTRLLSAPDFTQGLRGHSRATVRSGELRTAHDAGPGELGKQAAQRVLHGIRGG